MKNSLTIIIISTCLVVLTPFLIYFGNREYKNWYFANRGLGSNGGSYIQNEKVFSSDGLGLNDLSIEDDMVIRIENIVLDDAECGDLSRIKNNIKTTKNNVKIEASFSGCQKDGKYNQFRILQGGDLFNFENLQYNYKYNLENDKSITPTTLDCVAYTSKGVNLIKIGLRVKNSSEDRVSKNLSCSLNNLPSGEYIFSYIGSSKYQEVINL